MCPAPPFTGARRVVAPPGYILCVSCVSYDRKRAHVHTIIPTGWKFNKPHAAAAAAATPADYFAFAPTHNSSLGRVPKVKPPAGHHKSIDQSFGREVVWGWFFFKVCVCERALFARLLLAHCAPRFVVRATLMCAAIRSDPFGFTAPAAPASL